LIDCLLPLELLLTFSNNELLLISAVPDIGEVIAKIISTSRAIALLLASKNLFQVSKKQIKQLIHLRQGKTKDMQQELISS